MNNLKNTFETEKKGLTDKQQDMEKIKSDNESQLKSQLELKCKELSDVQAKQKVAMTHARYEQIRRFEQRPFVGNYSVFDEGPLFETSNLFVSFG